MKHLKMLGLTAVAAGALMALVGVGTASATRLCEAPEAACSAANTVKTGTALTFTAEDSLKTTGPFSLIIMTCTESTLEGNTTNEAGASVAINLTKVSFGKCNRPISTVNTSGGETLGTLAITWAGGSSHNGSVSSNDTTLTVKEVPGFGTCHYLSNNTSIGTLTGRTATGGAPTIDLTANMTAEAGSSCPTDAWSGHYIYTGGTAFDVSG